MTSSLDALAATGLQTEFFQLVQTALYHADGMWGDATVDLYLRNLPTSHGYMVAAGIEDAVRAVQNLRFSDDDVNWLREQPMYAKLGGTFFESLKHFQFQGDIWAVPEGTPVFPLAPIMRITAPLPQVGLLEMLITQAIGCASAVATNAARMHAAAGGRSILDFGTRRVPGTELAAAAARAAYVGGCAGTTHAMAARSHDIPVVGLISDTMLAAYEDVALAYDALSSHFPDGCHLNLPTEGPLDAIDRFERIQEHVRTVRVDHPELAEISREVRRRLDAKGMTHTKILGSGSLDAQSIQMLMAEEAPIDLFAVGQALTQGITGTGPQLCYRMAALVRGTSPDPIVGHWSSHWPGVKQVLRYPDRDLVCSEVEASVHGTDATPILSPIVIGGERRTPARSIDEVRAHCARTLAALSPAVRRLTAPERHPVVASDTLQGLKAKSITG